MQKRLNTLFPRGIQKVTLQDFTAPPTDGLMFAGDSELLHAAGLQPGDVIVAAYGIRVYDNWQYTYVRNLYSTPELDLIVWLQKDHIYREVKASPPHRLFGVNLEAYQPNMAGGRN